MKNFFCLFLLAATPSYGAERVCPPGTYFSKAHPRRAFYKADGTFVGATNVASSCKEKSRSDTFWLPKLQEGRPPNWTLTKEVVAAWTEEEKQRILNAFEDLPEFLWSARVKGLYRLQRSRDFPNPSALKGGHIAIYDSAFSLNYRLARVLAHELAHVKFEELSDSELDEYYKIAGWKKSVRGRILVLTGRKSGYVQEDGGISPNEDFANNLEYFLFAPQELMAKTPGVFDWIQKKYGSKLKLKGDAK